MQIIPIPLKNVCKNRYTISGAFTKLKLNITINISYNRIAQEGVGNHVFSGRVLIDDNNFTSFAF